MPSVPDAGPDTGPDQIPDLLPFELIGGGDEDDLLPDPLPAPPLCTVYMDLANVNGYEKGVMKLVLPHTLADGAFVADHTQTKQVALSGEGATTGRIVFDPVPQGVLADVEVAVAKFKARITVPNQSVYRIETAGPET